MQWNGIFVKIAHNLEADVNEQARRAPLQNGKDDKFGECGENFSKLLTTWKPMKIKQAGKPASRQAGEFGEVGECGENGNFVKIGDNLEATM